MFYLTGLPGWMRFGFSPGWLGRSPTGLGPTASFLLTGMWPTPQAQAYWQAVQSGQAPFPAWGPMWGPATPGTQLPRDVELQMLRNQAQWLRQTLEQIETRIGELEEQSEQ